MIASLWEVFELHLPLNYCEYSSCVVKNKSAYAAFLKLPWDSAHNITEYFVDPDGWCFYSLKNIPSRTYRT